MLPRLARLSERKHVVADHIAGIYTALGDRDSAFAWLNRAYADRSSDLVYLRVDPTFNRLRSDPRFQDLLRRMNFPP